ncbi:MAG: PH domain-containing protein [Candidatus Kerfeldbacteria bacterium]|nr:PH domain-containing protein [Candidatus Kerfeldbacteria bacterium]
MNLHDYISKQLKDQEELVRIVRRHPIVLVPGIGFGTLLVLVDFFLIAWWFQYRLWGVSGWLFMLIVGGLVIARTIYVWSHNAMAITTRRIVDINQRGFFERHVAEAPYETIQDVRYTVKGLWPTIFHFGTIIVQTAGTTTNLELTGVKHPVELQQEISDLQRQVNPAGDELSASELVAMVERLKKHLGPDGVQRLLNTSPTRHGETRS